MKRRRIYQIGAVPPPFGGVAVHVQRLHERLLTEGFDSRVIDLSAVPKTSRGVQCASFKVAALQLLLARRSILHFHNFSVAAARAFLWLAKRHDAILSFHNERFGAEFEPASKIDRERALAALRAMKYLIVDGEHTRLQLAAIIGNSDQIKVIPEFIPAAPDENPLEHLPVDIVALRRRYRYLLATSASDLVVSNGEDRYGIDILIEATARLRELSLDVCALAVIPNVRHEPYFAELQQKAASMNVSQFIAFIRQPIATIEPLWQVADLVIRATNTDGNALTIWESLSCGTPVVASNCVPRPQGTILFRNRDVNDLTEKIATALGDIETERVKVRNLALPDHAAGIIELYRSLS